MWGLLPYLGSSLPHTFFGLINEINYPPRGSDADTVSFRICGNLYGMYVVNSTCRSIHKKT